MKSLRATMCWCFRVFNSSISVRRFSVEALFRLLFKIHLIATTSRTPVCNTQQELAEIKSDHIMSMLQSWADWWSCLQCRVIRQMRVTLQFQRLLWPLERNFEGSFFIRMGQQKKKIIKICHKYQPEMRKSIKFAVSAFLFQYWK